MTLHCAATLIVRPVETALGQIETLRQQRIAAVYAAHPQAPDVAGLAADLGLTPTSITVVPGEGWGFAHLNEAVLHGLSDLHRGENVLVLVADEHPVEAMEIEIGDDGMRVLRSPDHGAG